MVCQECIDLLTAISHFQRQIQRNEVEFFEPKRKNKKKRKTTSAKNINEVPKFCGNVEQFEVILRTKDCGKKNEKVSEDCTSSCSNCSSCGKCPIEQQKSDSSNCENQKSFKSNSEQQNIEKTPKKWKKKCFKCTKCPKLFSSKQGAMLHLQGFHMKICYVCDICGKTRTRKGNLKLHIEKDHLNISRAKANCFEVCKNTNAPSSNLKLKIRRRTESIHQRSKPFKCIKCGIFFRSFYNLTSHQKTKHSTEYDFECEICKKPFKLKIHLYKHMKVHLKTNVS